jgi:UDP-N-acetylglucosamine/UDP-N-acetylgalactosamine diphosphorylase
MQGGNHESIRRRLEAAGQDHLLRFLAELNPDAQSRLIDQISQIDLESVPELVQEYVRRKPDAGVPARPEPASYYPANPSSPTRPWDAAKFRSLGESLLRAGKVAAFTVAGGQGSRLGFEGPKGMYPAGAVTGKPLFQIFAEGLLAGARKFGKPVPWYIMTSPLNHEPTVAFFRERGFFGLREADVVFFPQGVLPSFEMGSGKILLAAKDEVATNPDGHGGSIRALHQSGALDDMRRRGAEHVSYFQVDNPIVRVADPVFIGLHAGAPDSSGEMSSKMIPKASPEEKVGVFVRENGRTQVIEYSDLPADLAQQRDASGGLRFLAGSIAVHIMSVKFLTRLNTERGFSLPFHRAEKKVPHVDLKTGEMVSPKDPNGIKLERFVFDALPLCRASIVLETERVEEFAPIKNASGVDSPQSSGRIQTQRAAGWLRARGVEIPIKDGEPDCTLEIGPLTATEARDLEGRTLPKRIERGAKTAI